MSAELSLIRRIIDTQGVQGALDYGITESDFTEQQAKVAWQIVYNWFLDPATRGSTISLHVFQKHFSSVPLQDIFPGQTLDTLCFLVRTNRMRREASQAMVDLASEMEAPNADMITAMARLSGRMNSLIALGQTKNSDFDSAKGFSRQLQRILDIRAGIDNAVAPWPWEALQRATLGVQPDDYVVFYGRPKQMKSWVLAYLIAFYFDQQIPIVVYTKEMTPDNIYQRVISVLLKQVYQNYRLGNVSEEELAYIRDSANAMMQDQILSRTLVVLSGRDVPAGADTVEWYKSKLEKYKPKIGMVDGLYLLAGSARSKQQKDNERVQSISRGLRGIPLELGIPIIATNQANRAAAKNRDANLDELAFSDALAQDATLAARVIADKASPTISIVIGGSREFKMHGFRINAQPAVDFSYHSELTEEDITAAKAAEQADEENKKGKKTKRQPTDNPNAVDDAKETQQRLMEAANAQPAIPS